MSLVEQALLLQWRVEAEQEVRLRVEKFFGKLGVGVEENLARGVVWVPTYHTVETHNWVWFENKFVAFFSVLLWVVERLVFINSDLRLLG